MIWIAKGSKVESKYYFEKHANYVISTRNSSVDRFIKILIVLVIPNFYSEKNILKIFHPIQNDQDSEKQILLQTIYAYLKKSYWMITFLLYYKKIDFVSCNKLFFLKCPRYEINSLERTGDDDRRLLVSDL